jgi:phosphoglycerate kinase
LNKFTVKDLPVKGKRVFVRVDFNVPMSDTGKITSDNRIKAALPTINYIIEQGGIPILASHFGRPKGLRNPAYTLRPVAEHLSGLLNRPVKFAPDCVGPETEALVKAARFGDIVLLENLRFHPEEEKNDPQFAKSLADLAEFYVNDAFGAAHRAHASTEGMAKYFPKPAAGLLMEKEIVFLSRVTEQPEHPFVAVIGGAKVSDKLAVIRNLLPKVDTMLLGGGVIFNFFKAKGLEIGKSLFEPEMMREATSLLKEPKIRLPSDIVVGSSIDKTARFRNVAADAIPADWLGLDIGSAGASDFADIISRAKTIVWAGPMGLYELDQFAAGTQAVAQAIVEATARGATSVVGGGDTAAALGKFGLKKQVTHVSTGGGASLEFLEGRNLPGIAALKDK